MAIHNKLKKKHISKYRSRKTINKNKKHTKHVKHIKYTKNIEHTKFGKVTTMEKEGVLTRESIREQLTKEGYTPTYFLDSCFVLYANESGIFMEDYHINMKKILGLKQHPAVLSNIEKDLKYLKKHNKVYNIAFCLSDYNIPLNFDPTKIRPYIMNYWNTSFYTTDIDKRLFLIKCVIANFLDYNNMKDTFIFHRLYNDISKTYPDIAKKHMKPTFLIKDSEKLKFPKMYIIMPEYTNVSKLIKSNTYIKFASNKKELDDVIEFYKNENIKCDLYASEYILNPILYKTKKTHVLMNYIITYIRGEVKGFMYNEGRIFTAEDPYNTDKPFTIDVHNTFPAGTRNEIFFPKIYDSGYIKTKLDIDDILQQMRKCLHATTSLIKPNRNLLLNNQKNGFLLCGAEFIIDDTGNVFFVGLNHRLHLMFYVRANIPLFMKNMYNWITECVYEPCFNGTDVTNHLTYLK